MAVALIYPNRNIINGQATVMTGGLAESYNPTDRDVILSSGVDFTTQLPFSTLKTRYLYHGGVGGSGNWEH
jgi:hypothetical protein